MAPGPPTVTNAEACCSQPAAVAFGLHFLGSLPTVHPCRSLLPYSSPCDAVSDDLKPCYWGEWDSEYTKEHGSKSVCNADGVGNGWPDQRGLEPCSVAIMPGDRCQILVSLICSANSNGLALQPCRDQALPSRDRSVASSTILPPEGHLPDKKPEHFSFRC